MLLAWAVGYFPGFLAASHDQFGHKKAFGGGIRYTPRD